MLYDWANSAFTLCVITVIGSAYFVALFETAAEEAGGKAVAPDQLEFEQSMGAVALRTCCGLEKRLPCLGT